MLYTQPFCDNFVQPNPPNVTNIALDIQSMLDVNAVTICGLFAYSPDVKQLRKHLLRAA